MKFIILFIFASIVCMGMGLPQGTPKCLVQCKERQNGGSYVMDMLAMADLCPVSNGDLGQKTWESICIGKGEAKICNENCKLSKIGKTKRSISFPGSKPIDRPGQSYALHGNRNIDW